MIIVTPLPTLQSWTSDCPTYHTVVLPTLQGPESKTLAQPNPGPQTVRHIILQSCQGPESKTMAQPNLGD
ncbi:hypothetical protein PoB_007610900 [Plakobranchus ocellatus]|uniref:Uncharacterized protein n=1 Tax=Plakobranchus ocellatus TaxID=259542 RepID=A0AAV4DZU7_9GAST|nr:hypothetical protein PoB_007610900 [Plakobranchus ocellatus]